MKLSVSLAFKVATTREDEESFFKVLSPFMKTSGDKGFLDAIVVHLIKDEIRRKGRQIPLPKPEKLIKPVSSIPEVIQAIHDSKRDNTVLRVAGSEHSVHDAIFPEDGVTLLLSGDLREVQILNVKEEEGKKWLYCRVGAGCYLGKSPMDPQSNLENSLCYQVAVQGFGFPELGGIIYQSVGGFMCTSSAGGSLKHSFADVIQEIEFVDGNGDVRIAEPYTDLWRAVGVSMGLFGVITHVTFRLPEISLIEGAETGYMFADSALGPNDQGQCRLQQSLEDNEYMRLNWFPQKHVGRVEEWVGKQTLIGDIIPYHSEVSCILAAGMAAVCLAVCNYLLEKPDPSPLDYQIIGDMLRPFVPIGKPKQFRDVWFKTLPMDNEAHTDTIIKVDFTEIWIPLDQCSNVVSKLTELFKNPKAANNFATEMYGAKESPFWLSMSYKEKMVRVDPYWWAYNKGDPREFFTFFWDVLLDIPGTRLHWGKYLPNPGQKCGTKTFNLEYLKSVYPKMEDWLKLRELMDPKQVFVTDYWRNILEIPTNKNQKTQKP